MSKLAPTKRVGFQLVDPAAGVTGSRLYYGPDGSTWDSTKDADYAKPFVNIGVMAIEALTLPDGTTATLRIADLSVVPGSFEGKLAVALVDYDAAGNLSDFGQVVVVPLDHQAPPAPVGGVVLG